jgi:hypothetical protein
MDMLKPVALPSELLVFYILFRVKMNRSIKRIYLSLLFIITLFLIKLTKINIISLPFPSFSKLENKK